jgi:hypothetical protein
VFKAIARRSANPGVVLILKRRVVVPILVVLTILPLTVANCSRSARVASTVSLGLTPGSNVANFFSPFDIAGEEPDQALKAFVQVMADQNYQVRAYVDTTGSDDDMPGGAIALNFIQLIQGAGIIFFFTHGGLNNHLMVELYKTQAVRDQTYAAYIKGLIPAQYIEKCKADGPPARPYIGGYGICMTPAGITHYFTSRNAVIFAAECEGSNIATTAWSAAQLFFGYNLCARFAVAQTDFTTIFQRMDGKQYSPGQNGQDRTGEGAYFAGGLSKGLMCYQYGTPCAPKQPYTTVLSPAPTACDFSSNPPKCGTPAVTIKLFPKQPGSGKCPCTTGKTEARISFDTVMLTKYPQPASIMGRPVCATITNQQWESLPQSASGSSTLVVDLQSNAQANATDTLSIDPEKALAGAATGRGPHFNNLLDGNAVGPLIFKNPASYNWFTMPIKCEVQAGS